MKPPRTTAEWQEAVDLAEALLALDDARTYGLVTGGPAVNRRQCEKILRLGKRRGIRPAADAIERFVAGFEVDASAMRQAG